jgi:Tfp pilus tip-associated adhesin PilY1
VVHHRMGLCTIFCTVALAPAAERTKIIVVGGNDGMLHKANGLGSASQSSVPETGAGVRGQSLAQASDVTEEQDPLAPDPEDLFDDTASKTTWVPGQWRATGGTRHYVDGSPMAGDVFRK